MKQLSAKPIYRTYYVNSNIIYDIKNSIQPVTDTHAIICDENSSFPNIRYEDKQGVTHIFYLDSLITDGDKLTVTTQDETKTTAFTKVCHEISGEPDKTPFDYFKYLCERQIAKVITDTANSNGYKYYYDPSKGVDRLSFLGVPDYMFKQNYAKLVNNNRMDASNGATIVTLKANNLIDFTEANYNKWLGDEVLRRAKEAANNVANKYGKKVKTLELEAQ